jgi:starvation-inducible DNA-binding protein
VEEQMDGEPREATIGRELQAELRDLLALTVVGDHVRWIATGDNGRVLAQWLSDAVTCWRTWADRIATHMVSLGIAPDGRARALAEDVPWNWVPGGWLEGREAHRLVRERLTKVANWAHSRRSLLGDPEAAQLLGVLCSDLDAQLHQLVSGGAG